MKYPLSIYTICKEIVQKCKTVSKINRSDLARANETEIRELTALFPAHIDMYHRVNAIAADTTTACEHCGAIHGIFDHRFCSKECLLANFNQTPLTPQHDT